MTFTTILLIVMAQVPDGDLDLALVHRAGEAEVARATLKLVGNTLTGSIEGEGVVVMAEQTVDDAGDVTRYDRTVRRAGRLLSQVTLTLRKDGDGYRLREAGQLGTRRSSIRTGKARAVLDASWPEAVVPMLLGLDGGRVPLVDLSAGKVVLGTVLPRQDNARYLDLPGGGLTLEVEPDRTFRRLILPGEGRLTLVRAGFIPDPTSREVCPVSVEEVEATLPTGLLATVSLPKHREGVFAGVVLVAESGARDRDGVGSGLLSGLQREVAWDLADGGFAVIRFDPRDPRQAGVGIATLREDVRSAGVLLAARADVDSQRIGVVGHGQGGLLAVLAAKDRPDLFGAVVGLAVPARPLRDAMKARLRARLRIGGSTPAAITAAEAALDEELDLVRDLPAEADPAPGGKLLQELLPIVPTTVYMELEEPLLLVFGAHDEEVPAGHRALLQTAVALHGGERVALQVLPAADHEFLETAPGGAGKGAADLARRRHPSLGPVIRAFLERKLPKE
ncbi:MAG: alpha/beta fold hydrolase [Planctomycetota bacterium]|nr:alpha/beta fold hydrolase [Planctomycetota bacterium]